MGMARPFHLETETGRFDHPAVANKEGHRMTGIDPREFAAAQIQLCKLSSDECLPPELTGDQGIDALMDDGQGLALSPIAAIARSRSCSRVTVSM